MNMDIERLFSTGETVKFGDVREVRRNGDVFIKFDRRGHSFKHEFEIARALKKCGIPVTDPLLYRDCASGSFLATAAFDGCSAEEYLKQQLPDEKFFSDTAELLKKMFECGFIHTDFHLGNLLYSPETGRFSLVDVNAVKKIPRILHWMIPKTTRYCPLIEFRGVLDKKHLTELFRSVGMTRADKFYCSCIRDKAAYTAKEWNKRKKQILSGYKKFTTWHDGFLYDTSAIGERENITEIVSENNEALFLAHFYLDLLRIPHRRMIRFSPNDGKLFAEKENTVPAEKEKAAEMIERLQMCGIETALSDWRQGRYMLPELHAVEKITAIHGFSNKK